MADTDKAFSATRRRNVKPVSSIIRANLTRDVDCSAMADLPEDGQFVVVAGETASAASAKVFAHDAIADLDATASEGAGLRMVWGSALRSDRSSSGDKRVPVIWMGPLEIETNLYNAVDGAALNSVDNYPEGKLVSVKLAETAIEGSAARLLLEPVDDTNFAWCVGMVTRSSSDLPASGKKIRVMLFDQPRFISERD